MRYLSVCSGIEAATVAWHPLGWQPVAFSEIEAFPCAVLSHHYPTVPNWGDMTKFQEWPDAAVDLLVGGTPCQSFSVAGLRGGLADPRGNLALTYLAIADRYRPRWLVWENVPGVLSSGGGRDFGAFLGGLGHLRYGWAYRVLDAQYFGVAQRRRRVFVVGYLGGWAGAAAVLFERHSLQGHPAPRREKGKAASVIPSRSSAGGGLGTDFDCDGGLICANSGDVGYCLTASAQQSLDAETETLIAVAHTLRGEGFDASEDGSGDVTHPLGRNQGQEACIAFSSKDHGGDASADLAPTLRAMPHDGSHANAGDQVAVAFQEAQTGCREYDTAGTLRANGPGHDPVGTRVREGMAVRRLTPRECERLQGFPRNYTLIPWRGRPAAQCPDGPRYKALGNSMAVPVVNWIGRRIEAVDKVLRECAA